MVMLGVRSSYIRHAGYDPFSENDSLVQLSLGGGIAPLSFGDVSLAAMAHWEYGESSHQARGEQTELGVHRLMLGPELRYHLFYWLYGFGRVSFAAVNTRASLQESVANTTLFSRQWSYGFDLSAGAAFQLYGKRSGASGKPRIWVIGEGGYGWTSERDLHFEPEDDDSAPPQRLAATPLGSLAIRGPMFRLSAALTF